MKAGDIRIMTHEQDLDNEIRKALAAVEVPVGAKEDLLLVLLNETEKLVDAEKFGEAGKFGDAQMVGRRLEAATSPPMEWEGRVRLASDMHAAIEGTQTPATSSRRRFSQGWILATSLAILAGLVFSLWPASSSTQLDVLLARYIERIENEPIAWNGSTQIPASLRGILNQVVQIQPLGVADITPHGSLSRIHVYAFRNHDGKQILLLELSKTSVEQGFGTQLTPLNTNTGGWSCAAADVQGSLVVLAVPGNRDYLLKHLRSISVT